MNFKERIKERNNKIKAIEDKIKDDIEEKKILLKEIEQIKREESIYKIKSLIRVGSRCHVPQFTGGGWTFTVIRLEIIENMRLYGGNFKYGIDLEGILNNGEIFTYKCPYDKEEFKYSCYDEMFPDDREIIIKKY